MDELEKELHLDFSDEDWRNVIRQTVESAFKKAVIIPIGIVITMIGYLSILFVIFQAYLMPA
jgi:hypothetical protein